MRWPFRKQEQKSALHLETVLQQLVAIQMGTSAAVTPDTCLRSPTVQAIVTAVSRRISITPVHVYKTSESNGGESKEKLPNHPVARLLRSPNPYQTSVDYFGDMASSLVRHGRFIAIKGQGSTGPIFRLDPINPSGVEIKQLDNLDIEFRRGEQGWPMRKVHYVRGPAVDFFKGDSTVSNISTAIAIEIACQEYGISFFGNGAVPLLIFEYLQGVKGFKTPEEENRFIASFQNALTGNKRHKGFLLPPGLKVETPKIENDKAQFIETLRFYQTVIAGAWGVPPHLVGNLENGHYNNVEQQDKDFTLNVIMPYVRSIEAAMERDLLTQADRNAGVVIRFNMDSTLRASFSERQAGLQVQMQNGIISPNEWREIEGKNPREDGDDFYYSANLIKVGEEPATRTGNADEQQTNDPSSDQSTE